MRDQKALALDNQERQRRDKGRLLRIVPARYLDFERSRLLAAGATGATIDRVLSWRPQKDGRGLGLVGSPHIGKRRLIFALATELFRHFQIAAVSALDFEFLAPLRSDRENGASVRRKLMQFRSAEILIFTDLGAERLSETAQREFYGLVDYRASSCLPILWTTQFSRDQVAARFTTPNASAVALERGRAAVARLNEISDVIAFERKSLTLPQQHSKTLLA
jgi:DNA replication protein DnaC